MGMGSVLAGGGARGVVSHLPTVCAIHKALASNGRKITLFLLVSTYSSKNETAQVAGKLGV